MTDVTPRAARGAKAKKKKQATIPVWAWLLVAVLMIFIFPTMVLIGLGLLPTFVAGIVERRPQKYATFCVAGFNFSGVIPYLVHLWASGHGIGTLVPMLQDPFMWAAIYGMAALGWLIHFGIPPLAESVLRMRDRRRIETLHGRQIELRQEWGDEIVPPKFDEPSEDEMMASEPAAG